MGQVLVEVELEVEEQRLVEQEQVRVQGKVWVASHVARMEQHLPRT